MWKDLRIVLDADGSCLSAWVTANGRRSMNAMSVVDVCQCQNDEEKGFFVAGMELLKLDGGGAEARRRNVIRAKGRQFVPIGPGRSFHAARDQISMLPSVSPFRHAVPVYPERHVAMMHEVKKQVIHVHTP